MLDTIPIIVLMTHEFTSNETILSIDQKYLPSPLENDWHTC